MSEALKIDLALVSAALLASLMVLGADVTAADMLAFAWLVLP